MGAFDFIDNARRSAEELFGGEDREERRPRRRAEEPARDETARDPRQRPTAEGAARLHAHDDSLLGGLGDLASSVSEHANRAVRHVQRSGVGRAIERQAQEVAVAAENVGEEFQNMGTGIAETVNEEVLGPELGGNQQAGPRMTERPPEVEFEVSDEMRSSARRRAREAFLATDGWGDDEARLRRAFSGVDEDEMAVVQEEYYRLTRGRNLEAVMRRELSGGDEAEVLGLMEGGRVNQAAATIRGATQGGMRDPAEVRRALRGLDETQRADLIDELGGEERARELLGDLAPDDAAAAQARLEGDETRAQAIEVTEAANGGLIGSFGRIVGSETIERAGVDREVLNQVMSEVDGDEDRRQALDDAVAEQTRTDGIGMPGIGESLTNVINRSTEEGPERDLTIALLDGEEGAADAARLALAMESNFYEDPVAISLLMPGYAAYHAIDCHVSGRDFTDTADTEEMMNLLQRPPGEDEFDYDQRRSNMRYWFNRRYANRAAENMHPLERLVGQELVEQRPGEDALDAQLRDAFTENSADQRVIRDIAADGRVRPARLAHFAMRGHLGTNYELLGQAMHDPDTGEAMTAEQVDEVADDYEFLTGGRSLVEDVGVGDPSEEGYEGPERSLTSEVSGDEAFQMSELLRGRPENAREEIAAARRRQAWIENTPGATIFRHDIGETSESLRMMEGHAEDLDDLEERLDRVDEMTDEELEELDRDLTATLDYHGTSVTGFQDRVDEMTDGTVQAGATAIAISAAVLVEAGTGGAATPLLLAAAGAAGGLTEVGLETGLRGQRQSNEDIGQGVAEAGLDGALGAAGITGVPGAIVQTAAHEQLDVLTGEREIRNLGDVGRSHGRVAAAGLSEAAGNAATDWLPGRTSGQRIGRGAISGGISGGGQVLLDPEAHEGGFDGLARDVAIGTGSGMAGGILDESSQQGQHASAQEARAQEAEAADLERRREQAQREAEINFPEERVERDWADAQRDLDRAINPDDPRVTIEETTEADEDWDRTQAEIARARQAEEAARRREARWAARREASRRLAAERQRPLASDEAQMQDDIARAQERGPEPPARRQRETVSRPEPGSWAERREEANSPRALAREQRRREAVRARAEQARAEAAAARQREREAEAARIGEQYAE